MRLDDYPPPPASDPRGPQPFRLLMILLLALCAAVGSLTVPVTAAASVVPRALCAGRDVGALTGLCVADRGGRVFWLGTFRGYDGIEMYCLDYAFATRWDVRHHQMVVRHDLPTSLGGTVGPRTVAALSYLVSRYRADAVSARTAAAVALIIREVMGDVRGSDGQPFPGGLTASTSPRPVDFVPASLVRRARELWDEARVHRGPWVLSVSLDPGADGKVTPGERITAVVRARNGSGTGQDLTVGLAYGGFTGPSMFRLGATGRARITITAPSLPGPAWIRARSGRTPAANPVVVVPAGWRVNPRPGHGYGVSQRGLIGHQRAVEASAESRVTVVKSTPRLSTQASAQLVLPGAKIHDVVTVAGTAPGSSGPVPGSFHWSLLGPLPAVHGSCEAHRVEEWAGARVLAEGTVATTGDGTYATGAYTVRAADVGCLTYVETAAPTATSLEVSTPPGLVTETVLVARPPSTPCLSTAISRTHGLVGVRLYDRIAVGCISGPDRVRVDWTLHGPLAPRALGPHGCQGIPAARWRRGPVAARGSILVVRSGTVRTRVIRIHRPGCFTFSESAPSTSTTALAATAPGAVSETALVTRPAVPIPPVVPTGPFRVAAPFGSAGPGAAGAGATMLRIPALGLVAPVGAVGLRAGVMAVPPTVSRLGWLSLTAQPGDVVGSSVLAGHVADRRGRHGAFWALPRIRRGALILWSDTDGNRYRFRVVGIGRYPRSRGLPASVFRSDGPHQLRLLTCTRLIRLPGGGLHYADNLVVTADALA